MFYSELLSSPINSDNVKRLYGVNPVTEPVRALAIGIYPLTEVSSGYSPIRYNKVGDTYVAVANEFTNVQLATLRRVEAISGDAAAIVAAHIPDWSSSTTYATNDIIEYSGQSYKAKRASTNVVPGSFTITLPTDVDPDWEGLS